MKAKAGLMGFIKGECANYNQNSCLFREKCLVEQGRKCGYFEAAVLGPPDYPYRVPGYDYQKIFEQYGQVNPAFAGRGVFVRRCKCGAVLKPRHRFCEKCKITKRRATNREAIRKHRLQRLSVSS